MRRLALAGTCLASLAQAQSSTDLSPFAGVYPGQIESAGAPAPSVTTLQVDGNRTLRGHYSFRDADGQTAEGVLEECSVQARVVTCRWQDRYGDGRLRMRFDAALCSFQGQWAPRARPGAVAFWNGSRGCGGKPSV